MKNSWPDHFCQSVSQYVYLSIFGNNARTAGPVRMGEALIDVFRPRGDDGDYRESIGGTFHMPSGIILSFV